METLLCRRADLALSSGKAAGDADPVVQHHLDSCERCQRTMAMDRSIASALAGSSPPLPPDARRNITGLVHLRAREERSEWAPDLLAAGAAVAATAVVIFGLWRPQAPPTTQEPPPVAEAAPSVEEAPTLEAGEHLSGLGELVARHRGGDRSGSPLPAGALSYQAKLPRSLADQLLMPGNGLNQASWDGVPATEVDEATLFVLNHQRVVIEPALRELLDLGETLLLHYGPHQVTLSIRDGKLFVIIASPVGLEAVAEGPWL